MIAALVIPDFVIGVERTLMPSNTRAPLLVYATKGNKRQVVACCPVAKRQGVTAGMSRTRAYALCPDATELDAHPALYERRANDLCTTLLTWSDRMETEISDSLTLWLDLGKRSPAESHKATLEILCHCRSLMASLPYVGLAEGRLVSRIAAVTGQRNTVRTIHEGQEQTFLAPLALRQFQTNKRFQEQCEHLGIRLLGELGKLPHNAVKMRLGEVGSGLHRLYHGHDRKTLGRFDVPLREEITQHFDIAVENKNILEYVLMRLSEELAARLIAAGLACGDVTLTIVCDNRTVYNASRTLPSPLQQASALHAELLRLLSLIVCDSGVNRLTVHLERLMPPVPEQLNFFDSFFGTSEPFIESAVKRLSPRHKDTPLLRVSVLPEPSPVIERNCVLTPVSAA